MKKKKEELDVDFIGGQEKLTKEEELALSNYFAKKNEERIKLLTNAINHIKKKVKA
jgi:hypothetical protein